tara:strand:+ start:176 stop:622 length:447 start_codon:yes stop_codon:yes gene_type:complete
MNPIKTGKFFTAVHITAIFCFLACCEREVQQNTKTDAEGKPETIIKINASSEIEGSYNLIGVNPQGIGTYKGSVTIKKVESEIQVTQSILGKNWFGLGEIDSHGRLFVKFPEENVEGTWTLFEDGKLEGTWKGIGTSEIGREHWVPED